MKKLTLHWFAVALFLVCISPGFIETASAHRVNVFAWVEGDTVHVESKFSGGKRVKGGKIHVVDGQGIEVISGRTDDRGEFSFKVSKRADLKIILSAGQGHRAEWTLRASEIEDLPDKRVPESVTEKPAPSGGTTPVAATSLEPQAAAAEMTVNPEELEAIIERVLDRKLKPMARMLADSRREGPTAKEILAGIGYILGMVGIIAWVQSRKKKA